MLAFRGLLNTLLSAFQNCIFFFFGNVFSDSLQRILLFKISAIVVFKKPRNANNPVPVVMTSSKKCGPRTNALAMPHHTVTFASL